MDYSSDYNNLSSKELDEEPEQKGSCDFCQEKIKDDEEERHITAGDEGLTLCESCGEHYLD
jgi:hypothetical protein